MKPLDEESRVMYFLLGCIPARALLAALPLLLPLRALPIFGLVVGAMGFGLLYLYASNGRARAPEGGGKTWWMALRLVHGCLYAAASIYALQSNRESWIPLALDVLLGLWAFLYYKPSLR